MKKLLFPFLFLLFIPAAFAHCPLCTAAVGVGVISAQYYGLDMSIVGMLIGAFGISTGLWLGQKIGKYALIIAFLSLALTLYPLRAISNDLLYVPVLLAGSSGTVLNKVYWINKFLLGGMIGGLMTLGAFWLHMGIRRVKGKVLFPFQGIVLTCAVLALTGFGLYFGIGG